MGVLGGGYDVYQPWACMANCNADSVKLPLEMGGAERYSTAWQVCHAALLTLSLGCQLVNANGEHHSTRVEHTLRVKYTATPRKR